MRAPSPLLALALLAAVACSPPPPKSARDELLFELPHWCGAKRQGWTKWDGARRASPDGAAVCGVRLPSGGDDGVCVVLRAGRVVDAAVAAGAARRRAAELVDLEASRGWAIVESLPETWVRIDGETLSVRAREGEREGPCFHGPSLSTASVARDAGLRRAP